MAIEGELTLRLDWDGRWLGVMVTPWFMNLMLVPRDPVAWAPLRIGAKRKYALPAGEYEFIGGNDPEIGEYQICSLFSPMLQFDDHDTARLVATLAREALFDAANAAVHTVPTGASAPAPAAAEPGPIAQLQENLEAPLSKRDFLRARFLGGDRGDRG